MQTVQKNTRKIPAGKSDAKEIFDSKLCIPSEVALFSGNFGNSKQMIGPWIEIAFYFAFCCLLKLECKEGIIWS